MPTERDRLPAGLGEAESRRGTPSGSYAGTMIQRDGYEAFAVTIDGHVADVAILEAAMGPQLFDELPRLFAELDADPEVRVIVVSGAGANFSYGLDLKKMAPIFDGLLGNGGGGGGGARARSTFLLKIRELQDAISAVADCRTPTISAIAGWCIGGGVDLVSATDIRLASADARFSVREAKVAMVADIGSLQRLVGIIGDGHLRELALTAGDIDSARAERIGLVNTVYPDSAALKVAARALAEEIAANPPLVLRGVKEVLDAERAPRIASGLRYVSTWNAAFLPSEDLAEALAAFAERRSPVFRGE
jgi:enoyl-CoA hydratase